MKTFYTGKALGKLLIAEGVCPVNARQVELHIPADGALMLRFDVLLDDADLAKVARALATLAAPEPKAEP